MAEKKTGPRRYTRCKDCGRRKEDGFQISRTGLCDECGIARLHRAHDAMQTKEGPLFDRWLEGMRKYHEQMTRTSAPDDSQAT